MQHLTTFFSCLLRKVEIFVNVDSPPFYGHDSSRFKCCLWVYEITNRCFYRLYGSCPLVRTSRLRGTGSRLMDKPRSNVCGSIASFRSTHWHRSASGIGSTSHCIQAKSRPGALLLLDLMLILSRLSFLSIMMLEHKLIWLFKSEEMFLSCSQKWRLTQKLIF